MPERWLKNGDYTLIIQHVAWGKAIPLQLQLPSNARPHLSDEENRASPLENSNRWRGPPPYGPSEPPPSGPATVTKTTAMGLTVGRTTADTVFLVLSPGVKPAEGGGRPPLSSFCSFVTL
ncbi:hypothetical protein L1987_38235 [Smallanthus sonchifolius]|uniref:Uncharacterized protein n=1 Tax=Smallanthus sonchifolius TaxID=185202 RepID=A0ACB9HI36_9ASTR|nr:hypothetical protein L1987_38235 [Smallanthus sonchifolius]